MADPLAPFLDADGLLKQMPRKARSRNAALNMLADKFDHARPYTESDVNALLARHHTFGDHALLRRELFDRHDLTRTADGRIYHRLLATHGPIQLRPLSKQHDTQTVADALSWVSDYVELETGHKPTPSDVDDFFDAPPKTRPQNQYTLAVLDAEGAVKGLMAALAHYPDPHLWFIGYLAIDIRARGQGYGQAAVNWFAQHAASQGAKALRLCVIEDNPKGRAFWEQQGFTQHSETPPWTAGRKTHRRFVLERPL